MGERIASIWRPCADTVISVPRVAGQELPDVIEVVFPVAKPAAGARGAAGGGAAAAVAGRRTNPGAVGPVAANLVAVSPASTPPVAVGADA